MASILPRLLVTLCGALLVMACGFDSRTLSAPRSQRAAAAKLTPELEDSQAPASTLLRPLSVRVYVSRQHQTESPAWQKHLAERVAEANRVLAAELEARLQLEQPRDWPLAQSTETLDKSLAALRVLDPGEDVDFVLGLVASEPKLSFAFQELGIAQQFGKHLVLRGANDARELDAIEQSFGQLSAGERQKLYRTRRAHKGAAVLLHELAHAWGAPHARDGRSVLNARYSPKGTGFGADASRFLGVAFRFRYTHTRTTTPWLAPCSKSSIARGARGSLPNAMPWRFALASSWKTPRQHPHRPSPHRPRRAGYRPKIGSGLPSRKASYPPATRPPPGRAPSPCSSATPTATRYRSYAATSPCDAACPTPRFAQSASG